MVLILLYDVSFQSEDLWHPWEHQNDHLFHFNIISVTKEVQVIGRLCDFISKYRSNILERDLEDKTIDLRNQKR